MAMGSMICGILGLLFACVGGGVIGLVAVILGHLAISKIKKSGGTVGGNGMAITGLITGYISVLLMAMFLTLFAFMKVESGLTPMQEVFGGGEMSRSSDFSELQAEDLGTALGNSPEAEDLARAFQAAFLERRASDSDDDFSIFCRLTDAKDRCVFVVHYVNFENEDSDFQLLEDIWATAMETCDGHLGEGVPVGVGLQGLIFFNGFAIGGNGSESEPHTIRDSTGTESALNWFWTEKPLEKYPLWENE